MLIFDPERLAEWSVGKWHGDMPSNITGFCIDARKMESGKMFVALRAERDGHDFLVQAMENGASAALVSNLKLNIDLPQLVVDDTQRAFHSIASNYRREFTIPVVGITGSCGKTSTKEFLSLLLGETAHKTSRNLNNYLGVPLTLLEMEKGKHNFSVVEVGINQMDEMKILTKLIFPTLVLVTMIGESHFEGLKDLETVASEKAKLFENAPKGTKALFHADCLIYENFEKWRHENLPHVVVFEGAPEEKSLSENRAHYEIWTETNKIGDSCMLRLWRHESPVLLFEIPELSKGMQKNLVLAVLAAIELGVPPELISERLPQYRPSTLRANRFQGRGRTYFVDCYNANPSSMRDTLNFFFKKFNGTPKLYILGGMEELGDRQVELHQEVGLSIRVESNDLFIMIGEKAGWFAKGLLKSGADEEQLVLLNNMEAARSLVEDFQGSVLLKGSRSNRLENLLPSWAVCVEVDGNLVEC